MSQSPSMLEVIQSGSQPKSVLDSMFAETVRLEASEMAKKQYRAGGHYTPYMVQNKLHEADLPVAPMLYCDKEHVVVACPYCPMTHKHCMSNRNPSNYMFGSSHCCKGDYKFGDLLTGEEIRRLIQRNAKCAASKKLYKEKKGKNGDVVELDVKTWDITQQGC